MSYIVHATYYFSKYIICTAEPRILNQTSREHQVLLQTPDDQVPTILQCDIQPGLLRQRYSARWYQFSIYPNNTKSDVPFNPMLNFNLMLNVTRAMNRSRYQCEVTINHNGSLFRTYPGAIITLNVDILGEYVTYMYMFNITNIVNFILRLILNGAFPEIYFVSASKK